MLCGIWIFITVRCAFYSIKAVGFIHCCWGSLMIIPACAAMLNGIWPKEPKNSVTFVSGFAKAGLTQGSDERQRLGHARGRNNGRVGTTGYRTRKNTALCALSEW